MFIRYTLYTRHVGSEIEGVLEVEDGLDQFQIEQILFDMALEYYQPEGSFEEINEDEFEDER